MSITKEQALCASLLLATFSAQADLLPTEVGLTVHAIHRQGSNLNDQTQGLYALWPIGSAGKVDFHFMAAALRLSNDRPGACAGFIAEYGWLFTSLNLCKGYQEISYSFRQTPDAERVCLGWCAWRTSKDTLLLVPSVGVRFDLPAKWKLRVSYQPKPPNERHALWRGWPGTQTSDSLLLTLGRSWK